MSSVARSETSSAAASDAGSPAPSTPPTSPSKTSPPSSPKKAAAAAKREEAKKLKDAEKQKAKDTKWRLAQVDKIEKVCRFVVRSNGSVIKLKLVSYTKTIEKKQKAARALLDKLSSGWDTYALAVYQIKLLETEQVQSTAELEAKTKAYEEEGDQMVEDFKTWINDIYGKEPDDDKMNVDEVEPKNGTSEKTNGGADANAEPEDDEGENEEEDELEDDEDE